MDKERCVLAYSGGLDTSALIPYMKEKFGYEIICALVDVGRMKDLESLRVRGLTAGATESLVIEVTNSVGLTLSRRTTMEATTAKPVPFPRLISLLVALMGCVVVAILTIFPLTQPATLLLLGSGITVAALGGFLFFSL